MKRMMAIAAATVLSAGATAWAQSTATPDTGAVLHGTSTGLGAGAGQGAGGTTLQDEGGPANTSRPARGSGGVTATRQPTGSNPQPVMPDNAQSKKQHAATKSKAAAGKQAPSNKARPGELNPAEPKSSGGVNY